MPKAVTTKYPAEKLIIDDKMPKQKFIKLCYVDRGVSLNSPLVDFINYPRFLAATLPHEDIPIQGWTAFERVPGGISLRTKKNAEDISGPGIFFDIPSSRCAGLLAFASVKPNSPYSFEMHLKSDIPPQQIYLAVDEFVDFAKEGNFIPKGGALCSHTCQLNAYADEASILLCGKIDFLSGTETKFVTLRLSFQETISSKGIYLERARLSQHVMSREEEFFWIQAHYPAYERHAGILDDLNIRKKIMFRSIKEEDDEYRTGLFCPVPALIRYKLFVPEKGKLDFGYSLLKESRGKNYVEFAVGIQLRGAKRKCIFADSIRPQRTEVPVRWQEAAIDLSAYSGKEATLTFKISEPARETASGSDKVKEYKYAALANPIVYSDESSTEDPNIIWISIDALTMSRLGCYGYERRQTSPTIDKMAHEGVKFTGCITAANWTLPSHIAMFTGNFPLIFKKKDKVYKIGREATTIAEVLSREGYSTAAFTGNAWLSEESLTKGFDIYHSRWADKAKEMEINFKSILEFIRDNKNRKFFVFWHTYEAHHPFLRDIFLSDDLCTSSLRFDPRNPESIEDFLKKVDKENMDPNPAEIACMEALLDGAIRYSDNLIGLLLDDLARLHILNNTILVFTADHGNLLFSKTKHAATLSDEILKVPLIMRGMEVPGGTVIEKQVNTIDIAPTILDLLGLKIPSEMKGTSLKPFIAGVKRTESEPISFSISDMGRSECFCARKEDIKLVYSPCLNTADIYNIEDNREEHQALDSLDAQDFCLLKEKLIRFICFSLPACNFYLCFFGRDAVFTVRLFSEHQFEEDFNLFFGQKKIDFYGLSADRRNFKLLIHLSGGFKIFSCRPRSQHKPMTVSIYQDGSPVDSDLIYMGKRKTHPRNNPFIINDIGKIKRFETDDSEYGKLLNDKGCILYRL